MGRKWEFEELRATSRAHTAAGRGQSSEGRSRRAGSRDSEAVRVLAIVLGTMNVHAWDGRQVKPRTCDM